MSKRQIIILLGALVIIIALFSGLPNFWNKSLYILAGIAIITVAYNTKPASKEVKKEEVVMVEQKKEIVEEAKIQPTENA